MKGVSAGSAAGTSSSAPNNLPLQLSSFIGREREMAAIEESIGVNRLLTLTGPGGSGKTRLAIRVAAGMADEFGDGTWLVELASLTDPGFVVQEVASVFGVRETPGAGLMGALTEHLRSREVLLVLDNCEHLVDACAGLAGTLLGACRRLRVLATSREPLGVPGETLFSVPSLSLPDPRQLSVAGRLHDFEATALFVDRARTVRSGLGLNEVNAMSVARICYRLDGMPLAIELAAARAKVLSVEQISSRLEDSFTLLTGGGRTLLPRHRTLRATIDWSYELLSGEEATLLRRMSVFAGGFTLEAAEAVGSGESLAATDVLDLIASLVDKSLVLAAERDGEVRYRLLETVRQYGREKLEEAGELEPTSRRHAGYYLALAEEAEPGLREQGALLQRLGTEHDNFRAALRWALKPEASGEDAERGLRLAVALGHRRFWPAYGLGEGLAWLERGLDRSTELPKLLRAEALSHAGWIANVQGNYEKAMGLLEENYSVSKELGGNQVIAVSLIQLGQFLTMHGSEHERIDGLREETEALLPKLSEPQLTAPLLIFLGLVAMNVDDYGQTSAHLEEALTLFREMGDPYGIAICCGTLGFVALHQDDVNQAASLFEEALRSLRDLRDRVGMLHCLMGEASVNSLRGNPGRASRLWGAAEALGEAAAVPLLPAIEARYDYEGHVAVARSLLGREAFETAWAEGRAMSPEQAVEFALEQPEILGEPATAPTPDDYPAGLSAREVDVLKLVARGMTNARIADELYISSRTVNAHLGSIYNKIGFHSRAEATRFASVHGLL